MATVLCVLSLVSFRLFVLQSFPSESVQFPWLSKMKSYVAIRAVSGPYANVRALP